MAFKEEVKYGSVTLDFILECAKILNKDPKKKETLRQVLHLIGFEVSTWNEEEQKYIPCRIDQMNNVNVRCIDKPYMFRQTTVFSGRLRNKREFPYVGIYDKVDILDVSGAAATDFVNSLAFEQPTNDKVNTRKYTKKEDRNEVLVMDLPQVESLEHFLNPNLK
ncbi:hypothetical protein [Salmonella phage SSBI34]|nr:hypothetical protein [Salmonella phage SSBI34]